ncbi:ParA family protein [Flavobacterium oreochromis]|uniref:ParA family protein n=1 Tax=Flavobacterium oreochromis TaxID=2906078 RepID=UPI00385F7485
MKIITILTEKGGVGKTTSSIHLGAALAEKKKKVLLIDFDPQMNLSKGYQIPNNFEYNVKDLLHSNFNNISFFQKNKYLFVLKGNRYLEVEKYNLKSLLINLKLINQQVNFDYVIIDCPPRPITPDSLGNIALSCSDYVISPIESEIYSIEGINSLLPSIELIKRTNNQNLRFLGFFFNKAEQNTTLFKKYRKMAFEQAEGLVFQTFLRKDVTVEKAKELGTTVYQVNKNSRISKDYSNFVKEMLNKIKENE